MLNYFDQLFIDYKKACYSVQREILCNILTEFGIAVKLVKPDKMHFNEDYSKVCTDRHVWSFSYTEWPKMEMLYGHYCLTLF
jgi:hypothetical protein